MKFNSQICTTKAQSERLLALGLKRETADCRHWAYTKDSKGNSIPKSNQKWFTRIGTEESVQVCGFMDATFIPAWSLNRLIEIANLPQYWECISGDWYEEVIAYIQSMIQLNEFNKEYLE
jgi:hypothetical protein